MKIKSNFSVLAGIILLVTITLHPIATAAEPEKTIDDGKLRIIVFGAHPDDCEILVAGCAVMWVAEGHHVKFVSTTNGDIGHAEMAGGELAKRRTAEVKKAAEILGIDAVAVAYNRVKPHMEPDRRPVIQVGSDSITSGRKFLALYERDMNLLARAESVILIDDVVSTGGTFLGLADILEEVARQKQQPPPVMSGIFCVAVEGDSPSLLSTPIHSLATLPKPVVE